MSRQTRKRKKALPPAEWLRRRARHWDRRDLAFATALRAAAAELAPARWAPKWVLVEQAHRERVLEALLREAMASTQPTPAPLSERADAFAAAAGQLAAVPRAEAAE